jgi:ppGpp synthetase/RelA/SpoT-type nucleotidyltranferase
MEMEKFQEFMADQFAKMFKEFQGLDGKFQGLREEFQELRTELKHDVAELELKLTTQIDGVKANQVRIENKFDQQIAVLHDFRIGQDQAWQDNKADHATFETKLEELQLEARIADQKLGEIAEDISYLATRSFRQERQLTKLSK